MKNTTTNLFAFPLLLLLFVSNAFSQSDTSKISISVENIPKIQHKITLSETSWRTDKSPTLTYRIENDRTDYPIKLGKGDKSVKKLLDHDMVFLKVRYNPGKYQIYILRRGDEVFIEYAEGKPYVEITNRELKKHDLDITEVIDFFKHNNSYMDFWSKNQRAPNDEEKAQLNEDYRNEITQDIAVVDSLFNGGYLSDVEYSFYRNSLIYKKKRKAEKIDTSYLKDQNLHVYNFYELLDEYVFRRLEKKIISLGNGMARNSLESFDFAITNNELSQKNKLFLLKKYLKGIKKDFPNSTYQTRLSRYEVMAKETIEEKDKKSSSYASIYNLTHEVELTDSQGNLTTLQAVLDENKGKVVYIDFWASWCAPCRQAFPSYKGLKETYSEEEIVFVFISGDSDPEKWKKAELKEQLTHSYLATNYPIPKFYKDLDLSRFPRYLLFNQKGELVNDRVAGPDSDNIKGFLNDLLK